MDVLYAGRMSQNGGLTDPWSFASMSGPWFRNDHAATRSASSTRWLSACDEVRWCGRTCGVILYALLVLGATAGVTVAQDDASPQSVARQWNEVLLAAIRRDFARPTVHARNLFHVSAAMWDAWAVHDDGAAPFFLGRTQANGERCTIDAGALDAYRRNLASVDEDAPDGTAGVAASDAARRTARETAISHAAHRVIIGRFQRSPGRGDTRSRANALFTAQGHDLGNDSTDLATTPTPAVLGNLIADCILRLGGADGSNESADFANRRYSPVNAPLDPSFPGNPGLEFPNRWQPLELSIFVDQSGNQTGTPVFLGADWVDVLPFALSTADRSSVVRDGEEQSLYLDPGEPDRLTDDPDTSADYLAGHALVALWSAHLDPADGVEVDISPGAIGASPPPPESRDELLDVYDALEGGAMASGHPLNPVTGEPYATNRVPRGDYTRVLAEFWADGPDSETPPGHWFRLYNEAVADHPAFERRLRGEGDVLDALAFDVHAYLLLGGAMHDSAIAAWSAKGAYDSTRPVSALRYLANRGQSSDPTGSNYSPLGLPLYPGRLELVAPGETLAGNGDVHVGKFKVRAWRGPSFVRDPETDTAGVGWILLENWWPYQRPTFVTPPFAGYVSGHSTFSRAAADVLSALTGDPFFPGGLAEFVAPRDEFLVFEDGPSVDIALQWATYRDAADQTSLSRIWGGIHPPVDDLPGRLMGSRVAERVIARAETFFDGTARPSDLPGESTGGDGDSTGGATGGEPGGDDSGGNEGSSAGSGSGCSIASSPAARIDPLLGSSLLMAALFARTRMRRRRPARPACPTRSARPARSAQSARPVRPVRPAQSARSVESARSDCSVRSTVSAGFDRLR